MKKIHYYLCAFLLAIFCSSCEDDFDAKIYGQLSDITTQSDYEDYIMACYLPFTSRWSYQIDGKTDNVPFYDVCASIIRMIDTPSDIAANFKVGENPDEGSSGRGLWEKVTACNFVDLADASLWNAGSEAHFNKLQDISRMTKIINDLDLAAQQGILSEEKKTELIGEVRLLRGLTMYYILHLVGPLPVILDPDSLNNAAALERLVRPSLEEFTGYITDDLEYAVQSMPEQQSKQGRYNRDYARFCLMRHYLNEGYYNPDYYGKAYHLFDTFTGGYELFKTGENPYAEQFKIGNKFNKESIMEVFCTSDDPNNGGNFNPFIFYSIPRNGSLTALSIANPIASGGWGQAFSIDAGFYDSFEAGDLRAKTIITECTFTPPKDKGEEKKLSKDNIGTEWSGYFINKYPVEVPDAGYLQPTDIPLARWADVLLMAAEANVRATGSVSEADRDKLNQVRKRAGLDNITTADKEAFLEAILKERGHELFYEGCRKIDLIRFGKYYTTMSALGRTPTSQYYPLPQKYINKAEASGYTLDRYFTRPTVSGGEDGSLYPNKK